MLKGQLIFEFIIAAVLFFGIVIFVLNILNVNFNSYSETFAGQALESKAIGISELLVKNPGFWIGPIPQSLGLESSRGWPTIDETKLILLQIYCDDPTNQVDLLEKLDLTERRFGTYKFRIVANTTQGYTLLDCGSQEPGFPRGSVTRYAHLNETALVKLGVWVW